MNWEINFSILSTLDWIDLKTHNQTLQVCPDVEMWLIGFEVWLRAVAILSLFGMTIFGPEDGAGEKILMGSDWELQDMPCWRLNHKVATPLKHTLLYCLVCKIWFHSEWTKLKAVLKKTQHLQAETINTVKLFTKGIQQVRSRVISS